MSTPTVPYPHDNTADVREHPAVPFRTDAVPDLSDSIRGLGAHLVQLAARGDLQPVQVRRLTEAAAVLRQDLAVLGVPVPATFADLGTVGGVGEWLTRFDRNVIARMTSAQRREIKHAGRCTRSALYTAGVPAPLPEVAR